MNDKFHLCDAGLERSRFKTLCGGSCTDKMDISDYASFFSYDTQANLLSAFTSVPRLVDLAWPNDSEKANKIHALLTETIIQHSGTIKRQSPLTSLALLPRDDIQALVPHVACNLYDRDLHMLQEVLNIVANMDAIVMRYVELYPEFTDVQRAYFDVCKDGYDFLCAGFSPQCLDELLLETIDSSSIVEFWTLILSS